MSKYKPYPQYKDSGVEWLGEVPEHWDIIKVSHNFIAQKGSKASQYTKEYCSEIEGPFPVYSGQTENNGILANINEFEFDSGNEGYLFSTTVGAKAMSLSHLQGKFSLSQNCMIIKPIKNRTNIFTRFYYYHKQPLFKFKRGLIPEHMQASFRMEDLYQYKIANPQMQEQQAIANFLDNATCKIDTLIQKQQNLIELLKEKRQALISHTVTKGLNPHVKMKDSGVEWLGEVPEHWEVTPLRYLGKLQNGISKGNEYFGSGFPFVNYGDIYKNATLPLHVDGLAKSSEEDRVAFSVQKGDVFFTRRSETVDDIGMSSICLQTIEDAIFSGFTIRFRQIKRKLNEHFSKYYFRNGHSQAFFEAQLNLVTRASLGQDILKQLPVLIPTLEEQQVIANYLDNKTSKIDTLIAKAQKAIELLKERRTALISATVTGKIDIREIV